MWKRIEHIFDAVVFSFIGTFDLFRACNGRGGLYAVLGAAQFVLVGFEIVMAILSD